MFKYLARLSENGEIDYAVCNVLDIASYAAMHVGGMTM